MSFGRFEKPVITADGLLEIQALILDYMSLTVSLAMLEPCVHYSNEQEFWHTSAMKNLLCYSSHGGKPHGITVVDQA
jgi:hypothetical protein